MLVLLHPHAEATAVDLAERYRVADRFLIWLRDPRLARDVRELKEAERRSSPVAKARRDGKGKKQA
jgi:hypothetical protein